MNRDEALKWLLRLIGGVELLALPFVFIPFEWMRQAHAALPGLGTLPEGPVVEYLARGLSAMYALHGAVVAFASTDIPRFRPLIRFLGCVHAAFGAVMIGIDFASGLPLWWVFGEGPGIVAGGILTAWLSRERPAA